MSLIPPSYDVSRVLLLNDFSDRYEEAVIASSINYKTELCKKWMDSKGQYCPYNEKCRFAHGLEEV
jgi:hypothetical protein